MNALIRWSIAHRLVVLAFAAVVLVLGIRSAQTLPVDVFPDISAPTVTVLTESHGLAPEEVETLVTFPIESALNGAPGVRRVRSASGIGISIVWAEFEWGAEIHRARQVVNEKLQLVKGQLPREVAPMLAPISSVMGEILFLSIVPDDPSMAGLMAARRVADWQLRRRLLAIQGVSQVIPIGGEVEVFQVLVRPEALAATGLSFEAVEHAIATGSQNASGGFSVEGGQEYLLRVVGRARSEDELGSIVVAVRNGDPITVRQIATVKKGPKQKRGTGSTDGEPAVVVAVLKQPDANTLALTARVDAVLDEVEKTLPSGLRINREVFRQATFIERAIENVSGALRDGAILVAIILLIFLLDWRATVISLVALPLSLVVGVLVLQALGITLNTMTLGGFTIAIGSLVDDAIIDVENIIKRLRENRALPPDERRPMADIVYSASVEVRSAILYATLIIVLVFVPLFFLSGLEGRMLAPLGLAYVTAIGASLIVAVTVTPAMSMYLLSGDGALRTSEGPVLARLKSGYRRALTKCLEHPRAVLGGVLATVLAALAVLPFLGRSFLPEFDEGALTVSVVTLPGTSLEASDSLGRRVERAMTAVPEVWTTTRRTGRAELDEHAQDVSASEIDVTLDSSSTGRDQEAIVAEVREVLAAVPGAVVTVGQPLSHRIDHMLSGTRAAIAVKIFGSDPTVLRGLAEKMQTLVSEVPGAVDVSIEQQVDIPELEIRANRSALARFGMTPGALAEAVEGRFAGRTVGAVVEELRTIPVVIRLTDDVRSSEAAIGATAIETPTGQRVPLRVLAELVKERGPNTIVREDVQRKLVVQANVAGRDIGSVVADVEAGVAKLGLPEGYHVQIGGQFESAREAARTIALLSAGVGVGILLLLTLAYASLRNALLTLATLPLALIGGVVAVAVTTGVLTIPGLVGFITLFGIATRNGILMVSRFEHLAGVQLERRALVIEGAADRLAPILMTALSAALALVPLAIAGRAPGNEIQAPMAVVILGGLLSSTALSIFVLPVIFERWGGEGSPPSESNVG